MTGAPLLYSFLESPVGRLMLAGDEESLAYLIFQRGPKAFGPGPAWRRAEAPFAAAKAQLTAYFDGALSRFDLPLAPRGTAFQKAVWTRLPTIPFGQTRSYGWLAAEIGSPKAFRAVGAANGANPLSIILPCHRVVGATGALTGFGGGLDTKRYLLDLEARYTQAPRAALL